MEIHVLNRRSFLKKAFLGTISIPIITYLGTGVARTREVVFKKEELVGEVLIRDGVIVVNPQGDRLVLSQRCTHLGCLVQYDQVEKLFKCPCHRSVFSKKGERISGPAKRNLDRLEWSEDKEGNLKIEVR